MKHTVFRNLGVIMDFLILTATVQKRAGTPEKYLKWTLKKILAIFRYTLPGEYKLENMEKLTLQRSIFTSTEHYGNESDPNKSWSPHTASKWLLFRRPHKGRWWSSTTLGLQCPGGWALLIDFCKCSEVPSSSCCFENDVCYLWTGHGFPPQAMQYAFEHNCDGNLGHFLQCLENGTNPFGCAWSLSRSLTTLGEKK